MSGGNGHNTSMHGFLGTDPTMENPAPLRFKPHARAFRQPLVPIKGPEKQLCSWPVCNADSVQGRCMKALLPSYGPSLPGDVIPQGTW